MTTVGLRLRRIIRPLVPDVVVARLLPDRFPCRHNVDVVLAPGGPVRRWLAVTPDSYRVLVSDRTGPWSDTPAVVGTAEPQRWGWLLDDHDAVVVAEAAIPGWWSARRAEPRLAPQGLLLRPEVAALLGHPTDPLVALDRLRDAGGRYALVPRPWTGTRPWQRREPISADLLVVVLALVPLHDVGGGSRGAQLTRVLLRYGAHVVYVSAFGSAESEDLGLRTLHPRLEQRDLGTLDLDAVLDRWRGPHPPLVLVEAPLPAYLELALAAQARGATVVYDVIDRWADPELGARWYRPAVERALLRAADLVVATAPQLVAHVRALAGRDAVLVPNAVDARLFTTPAPAPADLPGGTVLGYHGSLYGGWFDWDALAAVAEAYPEAAVVLIGDPPRRRPALPANVRLLGLRAQVDLPGYVQRFRVGLLPFRVGPTTHATSPLKVYEYLAAGVPVAAPPLDSLAGLDGVHTADDLVDAVAAALRAPRPDPAPIVAAHGWEQRVETLTRALGVTLRPSGSEPILRRVVPLRYPRRRRRRRGGMRP